METVARYLEAIEAINIAQKKLDRIVKSLDDAARALPEQWATLSVLGIKEPFIPKVPPRQERTDIHLRQWPTLGRIARVLLQMHRAHDAAEAAWGQIQPEIRKRLASPPQRFADPQAALGAEGPVTSGERNTG